MENMLINLLIEYTLEGLSQKKHHQQLLKILYRLGKVVFVSISVVYQAFEMSGLETFTDNLEQIYNYTMFISRFSTIGIISTHTKFHYTKLSPSVVK